MTTLPVPGRKPMLIFTADVEVVNEAWKNVECRHFKDPHTACTECQSIAVIMALHDAGWRKVE